MDGHFGEAVAAAVIMQYNKLKKTGKPQGNEGTVLAGFVLTEEGKEGTEDFRDVKCSFSKRSRKRGLNAGEKCNLLRVSHLRK